MPESQYPCGFQPHLPLNLPTLLPEDPIFHRRGNRVISYAKDWRKAITEAGLVGKLPHDFRRTAVRNLVRAGVPERVAMAITSHKTRSVFERYNIVSDGDLREAAAS